MYEESGNMEIDTELPDIFSELGFEEGEWELFVDQFPNYDPDKLVKLYLKISRKPPYSTGWRTETAASRSNYDKKHDIATDTLESYSPELIVTDSTDSNVMDDDNNDDYVDNKGPVPAAGGNRKRKTKRRKTKRRKTKRRQSKRRKTRRRTRRYKR
jgi:hypothetical protein